MSVAGVMVIPSGEFTQYSSGAARLFQCTWCIGSKWAWQEDLRSVMLYLKLFFNTFYLTKLTNTMPKYVIEREIPNAGKLTAEELKAISRTSCDVLDKMGPQIQWVHSYVTDNKVYCVYNAPNEEMIREHAMQGGFPANSVSQVSTIIDPVTAE